MKREIKLRALTLENELIYFDLHESELSGDSDCFYVDCISCKIGTEQLFTGLKDKNGKEIYEGDILEWDHRKAKDARVIEFVEGGFWIHGINGFEIPAEHLREIIGNIYENPELINKP